MTGGTGLGILPLERSGIETRAVGIEAPAPCRGVAGKAVSLGMTGYTALQILAGRLSMIKGEGLLGIMKADAPKRTARDQSRADMAIGAELGLAVALVAGAFPTVRCGGMGREEAGRMVSRRCIGRVGTMALETGRPSMAGGAGLRPSRSGSGVAPGEVLAMGLRSPPLDLGPLAAAGCRSRNDLDAGWGAYVAGQATLLRVTGRATGRTLADLSSMPAEERRIGMARWGLELRPNRQRAWISSERLDRRHLLRVYVALGAEILGVTGGAGGGDRACRTGQLSMQRDGESGVPMGCRSRKVTYRRAGESSRLDHWEVAGGAGGVGRVEVRRANSVAGEAVGDNSAPHLHRVSAGGNVAGATWEHGISGRGLDHNFRMLSVGEPQIACRGLVRSSPLHGALDGAVVARLAIGWGRPQGEAWIGCAGVAPDAAGKDRPVLPVVEAVLSHRATHAPRC